MNRMEDRCPAYNPQATGLKLIADEMKQVGETIARKLNLADGPVKVLIPARGYSDMGVEGGATPKLTGPLLKR